MLLACVAEDPRTTPAALPDRASFPPVADVLVHRCGTLDCHGKVGRNLRLYGHEGLRLSPTDRATSAASTTVAEYDENFLSVVVLEPELMGVVVSEGGASPERLTLVRKPRGTEHHKGDVIWNAGDSGDRCLTSWLGGHVDTAACTEALSFRP
jgi:hypothetical protein